MPSDPFADPSNPLHRNEPTQLFISRSLPRRKCASPFMKQHGTIPAPLWCRDMALLFTQENTHHSYGAVADMQPVQMQMHPVPMQTAQNAQNAQHPVQPTQPVVQQPVQQPVQNIPVQVQQVQHVHEPVQQHVQPVQPVQQLPVPVLPMQQPVPVQHPFAQQQLALQEPYAQACNNAAAWRQNADAWREYANTLLQQLNASQAQLEAQPTPPAAHTGVAGTITPPVPIPGAAPGAPGAAGAAGAGAPGAPGGTTPAPNPQFVFLDGDAPGPLTFDESCPQYAQYAPGTVPAPPPTNKVERFHAAHGISRDSNGFYTIAGTPTYKRRLPAEYRDLYDTTT